MTFESLLLLWRKFQCESGASRLDSYLVLSENVLYIICSNLQFINTQNFHLSLGTSSTWQSIFERRGLPKVLIIKSENIVEFVSN